MPERLAEFYHFLSTPYRLQLEEEGEKTGIPESGQNLAKALAHFWDSDGKPFEYGRSRVLDLATDPDPNLQAGLLGGANVSLTAVARKVMVEGHEVCLVDFNPNAPLPKATKQVIAQALRRNRIGLPR